MKCSLLLIGLLTWAVCGGAAERFAVFSPNKLFIAAGSPLDGQFELSLHKVTGKNTELVWSNSFPETTFGNWLLAFVSEKEPAVVIQSGYVDKDSQADLAFVLNGKLVRSWSLKDVFALIPKPAQKPRTDESPAETADPALKELEAKNREDEEQRERGRIWHSEGTIQRFEQVEGSTVFCLWLAGYDRWLGWNVTNGTSFKLPDSVRVELNAKTRAWSTNLIANKEKLFEAAKDPAASAESFFHQPDPDKWYYFYEVSQIEHETKMAYRFVAKKKVPEDRALLEQLLTAEPHNYGSGFDEDEQTGEPIPFFSVSSSDRNMGDFLLAEWDKKLSPDRTWDVNGGSPTLDEEYVKLGRIFGNIRFSAPLTNGTVWAYLIQAEWEVGRWKTNAAAMTAHEDIGFTVELYGGKAPTTFMRRKKFSGLVANLQFGFQGALPGIYRVKTVWDKTTSASRESNPTTIPKSYQLESAEVGPVTVVAGRTLKGLTIWCTNQVAGDALATKALTSGDRILDSGVRPLSPLPEPEQEYEIMAATFRHIVSRHLARLATPPSCFFLATGKHGRLLEPPPELLEKLKGESIPIKSFAAAVVEKGNYVNGDSHEVAPVIQICPIEWQEDRAIVPGKAFSEEDRLNYVETKYVLVRRDGRWTVLGHKADF